MRPTTSPRQDSSSTPLQELTHQCCLVVNGGLDGTVVFKGVLGVGTGPRSTTSILEIFYSVETASGPWQPTRPRQDSIEGDCLGPSGTRPLSVNPPAMGCSVRLVSRLDNITGGSTVVGVVGEWGVVVCSEEHFQPTHRRTSRQRVYYSPPPRPVGCTQPSLLIDICTCLPPQLPQQLQACMEGQVGELDRLPPTLSSSISFSPAVDTTMHVVVWIYTPRPYSRVHPPR